LYSNSFNPDNPIKAWRKYFLSQEEKNNAVFLKNFIKRFSQIREKLIDQQEKSPYFKTQVEKYQREFGT